MSFVVLQQDVGCPAVHCIQDAHQGQREGQKQQRLAQLEGDYTVCPGHGPFTTLSYEKQTNPYL